MAHGFPLYIDLQGNNCTIFGGGEDAYEAVVTLLAFDAKVTVINPTVCASLQQMDEAGQIRYLRRKYYRGDCSSARLCVALTDTPATNIAISDECKNKNIPVAVTNPAGFGTFEFPLTVTEQNVVVSISGTASDKTQKKIADKLKEALPEWLKKSKKQR